MPMPKLSFAVSEDEATLLTVMTRGLATEVEVPAGKDLGYAKNRAIDKLWQNIPFCHAVAAPLGLQCKFHASQRVLPNMCTPTVSKACKPPDF